MGCAIVTGGARATVPSAGIMLGDIAEGQLVKINENGTPVEFYVAKHDYESALNGSGRTLLVRKDCYSKMKWNSSGGSRYSGSSIDTWLNSSYKALLESNCQSLIGNTKFYYTPCNGDSNITTLSRGVFLLSVAELNSIPSGNGYINTEGSALPIYGKLKIAQYNGSATQQWTRTGHTGWAKAYAFYLNTSGNAEFGATESYSYGSRPCFTFPSGACFDEETMLFNGKVAA